MKDPRRNVFKWRKKKANHGRKPTCGRRRTTRNSKCSEGTQKDGGMPTTRESRCGRFSPSFCPEYFPQRHPRFLSPADVRRAGPPTGGNANTSPVGVSLTIPERLSQ